MPKLRGPVAAALFAAVLAAGCTVKETAGPSDTKAETPVDGGAIVYGYDSDPNGLSSVANAWDQSGLLVANALFDTLAAYDATGTPQPYLAQSFEHNSSYTQWTVHVRPGVRFHDGTLFDADAGLKMVEALRKSPV